MEEWKVEIDGEVVRVGLEHRQCYISRVMVQSKEQSNIEKGIDNDVGVKAILNGNYQSATASLCLR